MVLFTGTDLRHKRFAYRLQQEFGPLVLAWYEIAQQPQSAPGGKAGALIEKARKRVMRSVEGNNVDLAEVRRYLSEHGLLRTARRARSGITGIVEGMGTTRALFRRRVRRLEIEKTILGPEVESIARSAHLQPRRVTDPNAPEVVEEVRALDAYFLLTLGGPLYKKPLLQSVRGVPINQHAGWSPTFKGSETIEWALYRRDLDCVGSTVHLTVSGADAGPILRRSHTCLVPGEPPEACFVRTVALGTELLIECVRDIIANQTTTVFDQPRGVGQTFVTSELSGLVLDSIERDSRSGWMQRELDRRRRF